MSGDRENSEAKEPRPRSWWARVRARWGPWLFTTLAGLVVTTIAVFIWAKGIQSVKTWYAERQNISYDEALKVAKENVGASAVDVIPFRNADSKQQYIAVITTPPQTETPPTLPDAPGDQKEANIGNPYLSEEFRCAYTPTSPSTDGPLVRKCYPITILRKTEDFSPEIIDPGLVAYATNFDYDEYRVVEGKVVFDEPAPEKEYRDSLWGVVDVDNDGNKEVYSVYRALPSTGTGLYLVKVWLYDSLSGEVYELKAEAELTSVTLNPQFTGETPKEAFATFMYQKADELALSDQSGDVSGEGWQQMTERERYQYEIRVWLQNHGKGFYDGALNIHEFEGRPPGPRDSTFCSVEDGDFERLPYPKGPLFGYDKTQHTHFIVWVPESNYDAVYRIIAGQRYVWLDRVKNGGLLTYDKATQSLVLQPIPELEEIRTQPPTDSAYIALHLKGSTLYGQGQGLNSGQTGSLGVSLTLPENINVEEEFEGAASCDGP